MTAIPPVKSPRWVALILLVPLMVLAAHALRAQDYPHRVIRILATGAGGGGDIVARIVGQELTNVWGQQVVVENRNSIIANETAAKAPPDGYTLLINSTSLWLWQFLSKEPVKWDTIRDFAPVTLAIRQPNILVVHPSLPVKSVKELIALAKTRPGQLNYATGNIGSTTHLASELFNSMAGVKIISIYYKSTALALTELIGGHVQMMFSNAASVTPHMKSGKLKALAQTLMQPTELAPGLPTVAASGLPGYEAETILGIFAPAATPPAIVNRLNQEMAAALQKTEVKNRLFNIGMESVGGSPEQLQAAVNAEIAKWGKVIKNAGIRAD